MIRKIFICLIAFALFSCSVDDDGVLLSHREFLPIGSVTIPEEFVVGTPSEITLNYLNPSNCHSFYNIYYLKDTNIRTVAVISTVFQGQDCTSTEVETDVSFDFLPTEVGSYIFKFWQGEDENGEDLYLEIEVPTVE